MKNMDKNTLITLGRNAFFARDFKTAFERFGEADELVDLQRDELRVNPPRGE